MGGTFMSRTARGMWCSCKSAAVRMISDCPNVPSVSKSSPFAGSATRHAPRNFSAAGEQSFRGLRQQSLRFARLPIGLRSMSSMMPRHDATAAARLVSKLSSELTPEAEAMKIRALDLPREDYFPSSSACKIRPKGFYHCQAEVKLSAFNSADSSFMSKRPVMMTPN